MLATLIDHPFDDPDWLFEVKYDGYRALGDKGNLFSRNGHLLNSRYPQIAEELKKVSSAVVDGEIVVFDKKGKSSFQLLQRRPQEAVYLLFDILFLEGKDLRDLPLTERKKILQKIFPKRLSFIKLCDYIERQGIAFFEKAQKHQLEGIIGKKKSSPYVAKRSRNWVKVKGIQYLDAAILDYTAKKRSLILGDSQSHVIGKVGTGFTEEEFEQIVCMLNSAKKHYLRCRVGFVEWTEDKKLRQPRFIELLKEPYSHLDKLFWPKEGITKGDLIAYYREIAPVILPYLKDRPQVLHRFPDGIGGKHFYQKKAGNLSKEIPSTYVKPDERYLLAQDEESLLYLIQLGCIDLNPFNARVGSLAYPDYLVIDLDPRGIEFDAVVKTALEFRKICEELSLISYPKTSGQKGLHIYLPVGARYDFVFIRGFAELLCLFVNKRLPDITSLVRNPEKRERKVYLDFLQNRPATPMASVYSVRPVPGALVSTPLAWKEVNRRLDPTHFNFFNALRRLEKKGDLFKGLLNEKADLKRALQFLDAKYES